MFPQVTLEPLSASLLTTHDRRCKKVLGIVDNINTHDSRTKTALQQYERPLSSLSARNRCQYRLFQLLSSTQMPAIIPFTLP